MVQTVNKVRFRENGKVHQEHLKRLLLHPYEQILAIEPLFNLADRKRVGLFFGLGGLRFHLIHKDIAEQDTGDMMDMRADLLGLTGIEPQVLLAVSEQHFYIPPAAIPGDDLDDGQIGGVGQKIMIRISGLFPRLGHYILERRIVGIVFDAHHR